MGLTVTAERGFSCNRLLFLWRRGLRNTHTHTLYAIMVSLFVCVCVFIPGKSSLSCLFCPCFVSQTSRGIPKRVTANSLTLTVGSLTSQVILALQRRLIPGLLVFLFVFFSAVHSAGNSLSAGAVSLRGVTITEA